MKRGKEMKVTPGMQSEAPSHKAAKHKDSAGPWSSPKSGEQSSAPSTMKKALPAKEMPEGVKGVNEGSSMSLPKSGKPGESKV